MSLKWVDTLDIAIELDEAHPDIDPKFINFVDLRQWVMDLKDFDDDPDHSGERILEAIQLAWMEEKED
ncbi:MAG: Fe-S cluster assembly protein IscX [Proteobacteria bacterium]|nr:Fe-S cluster assembly protein IscX [Pseudomonadota bacterium]